jgi:hypothetical protein
MLPIEASFSIKIDYLIDKTAIIKNLLLNYLVLLTLSLLTNS